MLEISVEEFKIFPNKNKYIFFFTIEGLCGMCKLQEKEYEKFGDIPNLIKVSGTITDEDFMMELGIGALPCTLIFDYQEFIKVKKFGVQYETQIKELLKEF